MKNVIIVGASHAAAEAITALRRLKWEGNITLIGDEATLPYQRPPLSKGYYQGEITKEKLAIKSADFYQKAGVELHLGKRVVHLHRQNNQVELENGDLLSYSHLILATGTRPRSLPVKGAGFDIVQYLRTIEDVDNIKQDLKANSNLVVIGGGYIGLEVAASAVKRGVNVTLLEAQDRVLTRVTSPQVSEFFQTLHRQAGVDIRLNASIAQFAKDNGNVYAELNSGERFLCDYAIVGIGVIPNIELAEQADIKCSNGILVDEYTRTSATNIYAIGDCSNHPSLLYKKNIRLESVPNATAQARTAAAAICGTKKAYNQLPWFWSDQYDVKLQTAGLLHGFDDINVEGNMDAKKFTVSYFKKGQLIALDAINSPGEFMKAKKEITGNLF